MQAAAAAAAAAGGQLPSPPRPRRTVYLDGIFDLFHAGHLEAVQQCVALGDRVIIGVTGDADAAGYKRPPVIGEAARWARRFVVNIAFLLVNSRVSMLYLAARTHNLSLSTRGSY